MIAPARRLSVSMSSRISSISSSSGGFERSWLRAVLALSAIAPKGVLSSCAIAAVTASTLKTPVGPFASLQDDRAGKP